MRDRLTTFGEIAGTGLVTGGCAMFSLALGMVVAGVFLIAGCFIVGGDA